MSVAAFDTLKFAKQLKQAGVPEQQAEAQATALAEVLQSGIQDLATKNETTQIRQDLKTEIAQVRQDLKHESESIRQEMKQMEQRLDAKIDNLAARVYGELALMKWMLGSTVAGIVA